MSELIEIHERPLLFDRIQVSVTPDYLKSLNDINCEQYKDMIIANRKLHEYPFKYYNDKSGKGHYVVILPENPKITYFSNVRVDAFHPFTVSFKLNFIRLLRDRLKDDPNFRSGYDESIFLDENNYLNYENWPYWNINLVSAVTNELNDLCLKIADNSLYQVLPIHKVEYKNVSINQIETNKDYYVGCNLSLFVMNKYSSFIGSKDGIEFRKNIGEISARCRIPESSFDSVCSVDKAESVSVQFEVTNGLHLKVYPKDKDHIRAELLFEKPFLRNKFKYYELNLDGRKNLNNPKSQSVNIKRILVAVSEFSKDFMKYTDIESILYRLMSDRSSVAVLNQLQPLYEFWESAMPEINVINDCVINNISITDKKTIRFLRKYQKLKHKFIRNYNKRTGKYSYVCDPEKAEYNLNQMIGFAKPTTLDPELDELTVLRNNVKKDNKRKTKADSNLKGSMSELKKYYKKNKIIEQRSMNYPKESVFINEEPMKNKRTSQKKFQRNSLWKPMYEGEINKI